MCGIRECGEKVLIASPTQTDSMLMAVGTETQDQLRLQYDQDPLQFQKAGGKRATNGSPSFAGRFGPPSKVPVGSHGRTDY